MTSTDTRRVSKKEAWTAAFVVLAVAGAVAWRTAVPITSAPPPAPTPTTAPVVVAPLADGAHFVFIKEIVDGKVVIDTAEWLSGEEARKAAIEDGVIAEGEDLPNDFYIRNSDSGTIEIAVAPEANAKVLVFDANGAIVDEEIELNELAVAFTGAYAGHTIYGLVAGEFPVDIEVDGGVVTSIEQVYLP